jgi:hypothetical protein
MQSCRSARESVRYFTDDFDEERVAVTAWIDRPPIVAAMLNPALIAAILATAANGYHKESDRALPWPLAFVIVPLVLHRGTREALPTSTRTHLAT